MRTHHRSRGLTLRNSLTINGAFMDATLPVVTMRTCVCPGQRSDSAMNLRGMGCAVWLCLFACIDFGTRDKHAPLSFGSGRTFQASSSGAVFPLFFCYFLPDHRIFSSTHSMTHPVNETKFPGAQRSRHQSCRRLNVSCVFAFRV